MEEADVQPSPIRGPAHMFRCPVCDASGKTGKTLGFGGSPCALCQGRCYLQREPTPCPCCDAKGGFSTLFGFKWNVCRLCHGIKYLMNKPHPCPKCRATGLIKGFGGMFARPCDLCDRQRYLKHLHGRCIKCNFTSSIIKYLRKCINCGGVGYSPEPQHLCPRCNSTGHFKGNNCMICGGTGVIHHEVVSCAKCNGAGEIKRPLSLIMGSVSCPTCNGQGYFQVFTSGSAMPPPPTTATRAARKRGRKSEGDAGGPLLLEDGDDHHHDQMGSMGGSEPRRRVRLRPTPIKDGSGRLDAVPPYDRDSHHISQEGGSDRTGSSQAESRGGRAAGTGTAMAYTPTRSRDDMDLIGVNGTRAMVITGIESGSSTDRVFSPGVAPADNGKRKRVH